MKINVSEFYNLNLLQEISRGDVYQNQTGGEIVLEYTHLDNGFQYYEAVTLQPGAYLIRVYPGSAASAAVWKIIEVSCADRPRWHNR
jgi:hypothetical protein